MIDYKETQYLETDHAAVAESTYSKEYTTSVSLHIDSDYVWKRSDIKELIQFLKDLKKSMPKEIK